jgi:predicted DNA-binding transcriptional regulator YafY
MISRYAESDENFGREEPMRADRLLSLVLLLQVHGRRTARELAEQLEVSERTIARDLEALSGAGVPLVAERGPGGGWRLLEGYRTSLTGMTTPEVQALFLAGTAGPLRELGLGKVLDSVFLKLLAALPDLQRGDAERARQRLHVDAVPWYRSSEAAPHLPLLQDAVWQDRRLRLTYGRGDGPAFERVVEPYGLVVKGNIWYLVACADGQMRTYRVARMQDVVLLEEHFPRDAAFDLAAYWTASVAEFRAGVPRYPLTIRVSPAGLPTLPRRLGRTDLATVEPTGPPDANGWRTLDLEFDTLEEARAGILQLGASVEVLEPAELREAIRETIGEMATLYQAACPIADFNRPHRVDTVL